MPNYSKKRSRINRLRKTFSNKRAGVKKNRGPYNNGVSLYNGSRAHLPPRSLVETSRSYTPSFFSYNPFRTQMPSVVPPPVKIPNFANSGVFKRRRSMRLSTRKK